MACRWLWKVRKGISERLSSPALQRRLISANVTGAFRKIVSTSQISLLNCCFAILNLISAAKQGNVYAKNKHNPPKDQKIISF